MSDRERFLMAFSHGPLLRSDVAVVLMGEDAMPRLMVAAGLMRYGGAPSILLSGGRHEPPRHIGAEEGARELLGLGVAPDRIQCEIRSQNTYEQSTEVLDIAVLNEWKRMLLVASAYHLPRALLTFIKTLTVRGLDQSIQLVAAPASQMASWWDTPAGCEESRLTLLGVEEEKTDLYQQRGHVASYVEGLAYLEHWQPRERRQ